MASKSQRYFISYDGDGKWTATPHDKPSPLYFAANNLTPVIDAVWEHALDLKGAIDIVASAAGIVGQAYGLLRTAVNLLGFWKTDSQLEQINMLLAGYFKENARQLSEIDRDRLTTEMALLNGQLGAAGSFLNQRLMELESQKDPANPFSTPVFKIAADLLESDVIHPVLAVISTLTDSSLATFRVSQIKPDDYYYWVQAETGQLAPSKDMSRFDYRYALPVLIRAINILLAAITARDPGHQITGRYRKQLTDVIALLDRLDLEMRACIYTTHPWTGKGWYPIWEPGSPSTSVYRPSKTGAMDLVSGFQWAILDYRPGQRIEPKLEPAPQDPAAFIITGLDVVDGSWVAPASLDTYVGIATPNPEIERAKSLADDFKQEAATSVSEWMPIPELHALRERIEKITSIPKYSPIVDASDALVSLSEARQPHGTITFQYAKSAFSGVRHHGVTAVTIGHLPNWLLKIYDPFGWAGFTTQPPTLSSYAPGTAAAQQISVQYRFYLEARDSNGWLLSRTALNSEPIVGPQAPPVRRSGRAELTAIPFDSVRMDATAEAFLKSLPWSSDVLSPDSRGESDPVIAPESDVEVPPFNTRLARQLEPETAGGIAIAHPPREMAVDWAIEIGAGESRATFRSVSSEKHRRPCLCGGGVNSIPRRREPPSRTDASTLPSRIV